MSKLLSNIALVAAFSLAALAKCPSQTPPPPQNYPSLLPYTFSNLVWWGDSELRTLLKQRIRGLGDEIAPDSAALGRIRDALKVLLKEKGIDAEIQSQEPSPFSFTAQRVPDAPGPAIVFSMLSPKVLVDRVVILGAPDLVKQAMIGDLHSLEGRDYSAGGDWWIRSSARKALEPDGYLDPHVDVTHDAPRRAGDHYVVNLLISVDAGVQYRIQSITADGGPLLEGTNLSQYFSEKAGDIAGADPFRDLAGQIRVLYFQYGFLDLAIEDPPQLDPENATVSYHLTVTPGQVYHIRNLTIQNLNAEQEARVRELLGLKTGDIFSQTNMNDLNHKISSEPTLASLRFSYRFKKDAATASVDLSLDFYKESNKSGVTVK